MKKILIASSDRFFANSLKRNILTLGYKVEIVSNGKDALTKCADYLPDVIILEPYLSIIKTSDVIKQLKETSEIIQILAITQKSIKEAKYLAELGIDEIISIPIETIELDIRINRALKVKNLSKEVNQTTKKMTNIINSSSMLLSNFDPMLFNFEDSIYELLYKIASGIEDKKERPSIIFVGFNLGNDNLESTFYRIIGDKVERVFDLFPISREYLFSECTIIKNGIFFSNIEGSGKTSEDYQKQFPPEIRKHIGSIRNFVIYDSGEVCIIAFNYNEKVKQLHQNILNGLALHSTFLKTISNQIMEVESAFLYTIGALARAAEVYDKITGNHILRVNEYSVFLAKKLGLEEKLAETIHYSAQMHDVGKLHINPNILSKPGQLTGNEWNEIQKHTIYGVKILGDSPRLEIARQIAISHHENFDGTGYPDKLSGENIPLAGRIVKMADIYDALRDTRTYKPAFSHEEAVKIIKEGDNKVCPSHFDPKVLKVFLDHENKFAEIFENV